ncbi:MAG TPA: hypothetical protein VMD92_08945 [Acidobacteriaceae bacterium]|jgi:hypothetical protein|nr:hypothetical protein [Acidobacteriaceae bacterium]
MALLAAASAGAQSGERGTRIAGPGHPPQLFFACCNQGVSSAQSLVEDPAVLASLKSLHAGIALGVADLSPQRAGVVERLNHAGIPVIACLVVPGDKGPYVHDGDVAETQAAVANFERWTEKNHLRWQAVGLDIEPDFGALARLKGHPLRIAGLVAERWFDFARVMQARAAYARLIRQMQAQGFFVQTYQLPLIVPERRMHSTLLERLLGIVDVRGGQEALMLYTSYAPGVGAGIVDVLGPDAQAIVLGVTQGNPAAGALGRPLDWNTLSDELIVAAHFTPTVGVFNLEGCLEQGCLARIQTIDWSRSVVIPAAQIHLARRRVRMACAIVWVGAWLPGILLAGAILLAAPLWMRRRRRPVP